MASGPMRAAYGKEELYHHIASREEANHAVGVLETGELPDNDVCRELAAACGVGPEALLLLVARTNSLAGCIQIVARSVETALHKLHELQFDVTRVRSGFGVAPLPPLAKDDMAAIGRTNDAILYGADVTLWLTGDDDSIAAIGPRTPSNGSRDFGRPFAQVFRDYDHDFYKIDPLLFSPARITFVNLDSGRMHVFGELRPDVLTTSFTDK
jgi:methenyltetrahydromethanopterin cyclohydrolase